MRGRTIIGGEQSKPGSARAAIDPAVKAALEKAASDWRAHARQAEPLMRNHVATKTNRAAKKAG